MKEKLDQKKALNLYYNFFIKDIVPAHLTDSPAMRDFLKLLNPNFIVPSRRKLSRDIAVRGEEAKCILTNLLAKVSYVATTADSWSAHNRAFIGMTVHYIDPVNLDRKNAILGIKEIKVQQTGAYLARVMLDLHQEFGISTKVISTTTDNGANYVAACKILLGGDAEEGEEEFEEVG